MKFLDIGEVAARTGIKPSALRYYEEAGLIASVSRHGLRRQFPPEVLLQLKMIAMGKSAGFSLEEIAGMLAAMACRICPATCCVKGGAHRSTDRGVDGAGRDTAPYGRLPGAVAYGMPHVPKADPSDHQARWSDERSPKWSLKAEEV